MKTWAGGGSRAVASPSPAATPRLGAPQAPNTGGLKTGLSNTRLDLKKNTKDDIVCNFLNLPKKIG
jgi:hypothetical protein